MDYSRPFRRIFWRRMAPAPRSVRTRLRTMILKLLSPRSIVSPLVKLRSFTLRSCTSGPISLHRFESGIDDLFLFHCSELRGDALTAPVQILIELTQRMTVDRVRGRSSAVGALPNSPVITTTPSRVQLPYDPSSVLLLEILTSIVAKAESSIAELWFVFRFCHTIETSSLTHIFDPLPPGQLRSTSSLA